MPTPATPKDTEALPDAVADNTLDHYGPAEADSPQDPAPVDITDEMRDRGALVNEDFNPEDLVFSWAGQRVKVKTLLDPASPMGFDLYRVTGSIVDRDGKALRREDGSPAIYSAPYAATWQAEADGDLEAFLAAARHHVVITTARAHGNSTAGRVARGVGVKAGIASMMPVMPAIVVPPDE